ncbi:hypothetical protein F511_17957 [Dorcoceras hygrometricum]|uniref:Uncharacterized protein n=1 Tax=Dorcoceras hygrometricum TaxID=472368 RepID=A0A2Z7C845_9LAMI|nr:hypothetical protein F511_17957 [Dorcoceras hygrometricum]
MQSAVASIHQLQAISCCKQKSRPAVDTTGVSMIQSQATVIQTQATVIQTQSTMIQTQATVIQMQATGDHLSRRCIEKIKQL